MDIEVQRYQRKPYFVDAVRVTEDNLEDVARWAGAGKPRTARLETGQKTKYLKIRVYRPMNERQTQAFVGDWVLYAGTGFKVYTNAAFERSFEVMTDEDSAEEVVHRDAISGQFVTPEFAEAHPDTTVEENG